MQKSKLYAAYGSNMNLIGMSVRCPESQVVGHGYIEDFVLEFRYYANITEAPGQRVPVVIWRISEADEVRLDRYEGVHIGLYRKEILTARIESLYEDDDQIGELKESAEVRVMVYIMNPDTRPIEPPSLSYYNTIREGYEQNGMSKRPLAIAAIKVGATFPELDIEVGGENEDTIAPRRNK
ncbi:gamma-glutamylcyclotransferase family protein [Gordoniibacillus kamchatkensis]|uniref:gamma-glutamylcyclotransferase family protein n=1 Tax=Gordoniibacillus kamchatkensis TaxID=1590651 RepID=UPI0006968FF3|nr:gamma-glutamylcyclotransferase family protein [Paenibacillus sp. VKM B-2647]